MNKNIIIAILAIIVIASAGFMLLSHSDGKTNTEINFLSGTSLYNGDQVQFELKDAQGTALAGQEVTIAYDDGTGSIQNYNIYTDSNGKGYLTINGETAGNYDVTVTYNGTDQYNGCSAKQTITVNEGTSQEAAPAPAETNSSANTVLYNNATSSSQSNSTGSNLHYDSQYNFYYDDQGIIRGGQNDGSSADYIRGIYESGDMVDEDGNLQ